MVDSIVVGSIFHALADEILKIFVLAALGYFIEAPTLLAELFFLHDSQGP